MNGTAVSSGASGQAAAADKMPLWEVRIGRWVAAPFLGAALILLMFAANRGFDLTDEAYYVAWIVDPAAYSALIHPFGIFFHPLWAVMPSLPAIRIAGFVLVVISGGALGWWATAYYRALGFAWDRVPLVLIGVLGGLTAYLHGLTTPSYNILANAGAALIAAGLFGWAARDRRPRRDLVASALVGTGAWIAFLGKPTLAAFAAIVVSLVLGWPVLRRQTGAWSLAAQRAAIVGLACFVPLLIVIAGTVSIGGFIEMVSAGRPVLNFDNSPLRLLTRAPRELYQTPSFLAASVAVALATALLLGGGSPSGGTVARKLRWLNGGAVLFALLAVPIETWLGSAMNRPLWLTMGPPVIAVALALTALGASFRPGAATALPAVAPLGALIVLPLAIAFGSANPWLAQTGLSLFPVIVALALSARLYFRTRAAWLIDLVTCAGALLLLVVAGLAPYRLPASIYGQDRLVDLPFSASGIRVDARTQASLAAFAHAAQIVPPGAPIVDLSNSGPGAVMLLGGRAPFFPWVNANYANAVPLADAVWASLSPEEQRGAWFIGPVFPGLATSVPARWLTGRQDSYQLAARVSLPDGRIILLWRPAATRPALSRD